MLTADVTGTNNHIFFDDVKLNIGNAYNPNHGVFVAPYNGTYQFTVSICSTPAHWITLDFHVNALVYDKIYTGDNAYHSCGSKTIYVSLKENDDVFLKHEALGDVLRSYDIIGLPSFGGVFLFAE